jgi:hypothetical protein
VEVRTLENTYENLVAQTRVKVAAENQKKAVGIEQARQSSLAQVAGLKAKIEAERQRIEMLRKKFEAEVITPAIAAKEKKVLQAQAESATLLGRSQAEIEQIRKTMEIVQQNSTQGAQAYIIDNFEKLIGPFAETLELFPVGWLSIITGAEGRHEPISAVNPHAIEVEKNRLIEGALGGAVAQLEEQKKEKPTRQEEPAPALKEPAPAAQEASKPVAKQAHAQTADFGSLVMAGTPQSIQAAIDQGADVNARDKDGSTPLIRAAQNNTNPEVITTLLKAGADAKAKNSSGKTAFDCAKNNAKLKGTDAYWKLNEAQY